jgi:hypothetical protein
MNELNFLWVGMSRIMIKLSKTAWLAIFYRISFIITQSV